MSSIIENEDTKKRRSKIDVSMAGEEEKGKTCNFKKYIYIYFSSFLYLLDPAI